MNVEFLKVLRTKISNIVIRSSLSGTCTSFAFVYKSFLSLEVSL